MDADELIAKVVTRSEVDNRVIATALCGSYARGEARPDSDIDFCILTANTGSLPDDRSWIYRLGADARIAGPVEEYKRVRSIRVVYGSTEAEFGITDEAWARLPMDRETAGVINDGLRILYDPDDRLAEAVSLASSHLS